MWRNSSQSEEQWAAKTDIPGSNSALKAMMGWDGISSNQPYSKA